MSFDFKRQRYGLTARELVDVRGELRGEPFRVAENVRFDALLGGAVFSASETGGLAYSQGLALGQRAIRGSIKRAARIGSSPGDAMVHLP